MLLCYGGYFIYQEASNLVPSDTNRLESPEFVASGEICIDFWYHMFGSEDLNELNVVLLAEAEESTVWSRRGSQSPTWLYGFASVPFPREKRIKVAFDAVRGLTEYGDTAVDNVAVRRGPCIPTTTSFPMETETPTQNPDLITTSSPPTERTTQMETTEDTPDDDLGRTTPIYTEGKWTPPPPCKSFSLRHQRLYKFFLNIFD
ncbi:thyroid hormone-induced protein B-like [Pogona vitticeps]